MIGRLCGVLLEKQAPHIMVDVNGVGYEVQAPMTTFFVLPELGESVMLHIHFSVSENAQQLFGFSSKQDREMFRLLIKVNGVGPKMALGIMSIDASQLVHFVMNDDIAALTKVPGVGKKTAERLVIEMRDKLTSWSSGVEAPKQEHLTIAGSANSTRTYIEEAESALIALGYKPTEAAKAVSRVMSDDITSAEELIRLSLRSMLPSGK